MSASWQDLIDALNEFIKLCNQSRWDAAVDKWNVNVYAAQQLLPVHVFNQYCHPTRSFSPCPNFNDNTALPRSCKTSVGEWYSLKNEDSKKICFAYYRGSAQLATMWPLPAKGEAWMNGKEAPELPVLHT